MAKYNIESIRENPEFLNFAKSEYGYESFDEIPLWEQNALFYKFKARENDLEDQDYTLLAFAEENKNLSEIAAVYYPDKEVEALPMEDLAFIQAMSVSLNQPGTPTVQEIRAKKINDGDYKSGISREHYTKENLEAIIKSHEIYLQAPQQVENNEQLKEMNENYEKIHNELFAQTVEQATIDIAQFAEGKLSIDADATEAMQKYIETFGKEYQDKKYKYTPEAEKALKRLESLRTESKQKVSDKEDNQLNDKEDGYGIGVIVPPYDKGQENIISDIPSENEVGGIVIDEGEQDNVNKRNNEQKLESNAADKRLRSDPNLAEELKFDRIRLDVMKDMALISEDEYNQNYAKLEASAGIEDCREAAEFVSNAEDKIKDKDIKEYQKNLTDRLVSQDFIKALTPELTVVAYNNLQNRIKDAVKNDKEADISVEENQLNQVREAMDVLEADFREKRGYFLLDITNAADAYDGYKHMFDTRSKDLDEESKKLEEDKKVENADVNAIDGRIEQNKNKAGQYKESSENLEEIIQNYDEFWNLPKATNRKDTAIDFNDRINKSSKILDNLKFDEETLGAEVLETVSRFKFHDENGEVIPQFVDAKDKSITSDVWKEGMVVAPDSRLETVLKMAGNDAIMKNLGSKEKINKENLIEELKENIPFKLFEIYNSEETIQGAIEDPEKFTKKKDQYLSEFNDKLNNPEVPLAISELGYNAAMDVQTNNVEVFANRLNQKLGKDNAEYTTSKLYENIGKIDRRASVRGKASKDIKKSAMKRALFGVAMGGGMAYLGSRLITNAAATGGASAIGGAAIALGVAVGAGITATAVQIWSRKRAAKRKGEKYGWKEFGKDKMLWASIGTTTLACASAAFAMTQAPEMVVPATVCAVSSFGLGMGLRFAQPYRDMRLKGHNKVTAFALGAVNAAAVLAGGYMGRQHGLGDITPGQHEVSDGYDIVKSGTEKTYASDHIATVTDRNNTNSMWEYRGEGPHDIPAYRNPDNYSNDAWWTPDQHDKAIAALKEQMPQLGWKEGVGNEEVMLRKLASFERLHRNGDFELPDGQTVTEKFGDLKSLLDGLLDGKLTPEGAKQIDTIQYNVGKDGHSKILDSLGQELYSYQDHPHGIESSDLTTTVPKTKLVDNEISAPGGGVFGWVVSSWNKLKKAVRPGAKADRVVEDKKPLPPIITPPEKPIEPVQPLPPIITPPEKPIEPEQPLPPIIIPRKKPKSPVDNLMLDEYKIVYGIEPNTEKGKDKQWREYCERVEGERKATAPDKSMNEFLLDRRKTLDEAIMQGVPSENDRNASGKPIRSDYMAKQAKDDRGKAGVVMEARENLMQSNLTKDNFTNKITLSHFTKFIKHFIKHDEVVADGSRDIALNPNLKEKYKKEGSKATIVDLNAYLVDGKPLEQAKEKVSGKDARKAMTEIRKNHERG